MQMSKLKQWIVPGLVLLMAAGILVTITVNWNAWAGGRTNQKTDDAYVRADLTPLSTKVAGLVATVGVSDYQAVKAGDLLVQLRDDDFRAQVQQAEAAVAAAEAALVNNQRQKELQDARIVQAAEGVRSAEADITAAETGVEAAKADAERTLLERHRQEALVATESATRQKLEQVVADEERYRAQLSGREADLKRARARLGSTAAELEAQKRQRAVLDSQELQLRADLAAKRANLAVARINLDYTRITAPESGIVSERKVRPGQLVSPGTQVISLVQKDAWVQANYKETQVREMRAGDQAKIEVDAFPGVVFRGKVQEVSPASGSQFALLPPDNATGNFTKIVQRVPVKIVLEASQPMAEKLRPGMSVIATVVTNHRVQ
jgi:membrane fusion protein, multidrug efflux system